MINCILHCPRTWYLIILKCFMNIDYVSPGSCEWARDVCWVIFSLVSVNFVRDRRWLLHCLTLSHCYIWKEGHTTKGCHLSQATTGTWIFAPASAINSGLFPCQACAHMHAWVCIHTHTYTQNCWWYRQHKMSFVFVLDLCFACFIYFFILG